MTSDAQRFSRVAPALVRLAPRALSKSFTEFYEQHFDFVWRTIRYLGLPESGVDDAVQDTFLVAHRRFADFDERASRRTWLYAIAVRVVSSHRRSQRRRNRLLDQAKTVTPPTSRTPFESAAHVDMAQLLARALEKLPEAQREVFILAELEHVSAPEIARELNVKLNTVYSRLRCARAQVAHQLGVTLEGDSK
jgi:RNA polymerase sigma-70 factor (ECF subfamily)